MGRRRGGGGGCLGEVGVAGEAEAIRCHICLLSRRGGCSAGDLKLLGTEPLPQLAFLSSSLFNPEPSALPRGHLLEAGHSRPGTQSPCSSLSGLPKAHPPSIPPTKKSRQCSFPSWPREASCLPLLTPSQPTVQYSSSGVHSVAPISLVPGNSMPQSSPAWDLKTSSTPWTPLKPLPSTSLPQAY